ncbi:MAG: glycoside hydrolase family 2 protein [Clostridium sp.]|jgi:hypothetical protein|nr:glycoside hydrolase family 2 protein [Clostridium sp.]
MRSVTQLNERWFYLPADTPNRRPPRFRDKTWQEVELPHRPEEGFPGRYWYCKALQLERMPGERLYLRVDSPGANCRVFVGAYEIEKLRAGMVHMVELTQYHKRGRALMISFRFRGAEDKAVGGFPRGISLYSLPQSHFSFDSKGELGVSIATEFGENGSAKVKVSAAVQKPAEGQKISFAIGGPRVSVPVAVPAAEFAIPRPRLWSYGDPFLYTLRAILNHQDGTHLDTVDVPFGVRALKLTPNEALWNGVNMPLHGVLRHGGAFEAALEPEKEIALLRGLGADTITLTGTPEREAYYSACDAAGLRVFQTLGGLKGFKNRKDGLDAAKKLVFRLINRACIAGWAIDADGEDDSSLRALCELVRHADSRPIILLNRSLEELRGSGEQIGDGAAVCIQSKSDWDALDKLRAKKPKLILGVAQTKGIIDADFIKALSIRPWCGVFGAARLYEENNKAALLSAKNEPEDAYYLLRAAWSVSPAAKDGEGAAAKAHTPQSNLPPAPSFVRIAAADPAHPKRVTVYSNAAEVTLSVNGKKAGTQKGGGIFIFEGIKLKDGVANQLLATAGDATHARVFK